MRVRHYCDYNAGAPVRPEAIETLTHALALAGNPSSVHGHGRAAKALIEDARETLAAFVGAQSQNIVFTSGATEALHLAIDGARASGVVNSIALSDIEHDAVFHHAPVLKSGVLDFAVEANGEVNLKSLELVLQDAGRSALVSLMLANNETGVIQSVKAAAALARQYGCFLLVDASQAFGRMRLSIADLDATFLTLSSHKIGGPPGVGALVMTPGAPFVPARSGGGQERGARPGTENVPAIAAFAVAAKAAYENLAAETQRVTAFRDRLERGLPKDAVVFGADAKRLGNTSNFAIPGLNAETAVIAMDLEGVSVSSGSACSSGKVRESRVLRAMGVPSHLAKAALRVSFGWNSTDADVDATLAALNKIASRRVMAGAA